MNRIESFQGRTARASNAEQEMSVAGLLSIARRQMKIIAATTMIFVLGAIIYSLTTQKFYLGEATLLIDPRRVQIFRQDSVTTDLAFDSATLESQLETLRSDKIAVAVIKNLDLWKDPEFIGEPPGFIGTLIDKVVAFFDPRPPETNEQKIQRSVEVFRKRLDVKRSGLSYAIQVKFNSWTSAKATAITNEIAEAYILDQLEARYELTQRAGIWLQGRITDLRNQATSAERKVVEFKSVNQIVDANGRLVSEQHLQEINSQLSVARQQTQEARARFDRIKEVTRSGIVDATVTDALKNEVLIKLRSDYLELVRREADWSSRFGANHQSAIQLRGDMRRLERSMLDELKRIEQTYQSDFEIAQAKEKALQDDVASLKTEWGGSKQVQVDLKELESNAQLIRTTHDSFAQRYILAIQQQSFPISDARVITPATPPRRPSWPRPLLFVLAAMVLGFGTGCALALFRDLNDDRIRSTRDLEDETGVDCLGILPSEGKTQGTDKGAPVNLPLVVAAGTPQTFTIPESHANMMTVLRHPFSAYSETCRNVKVSLDLQRMLRQVRTLAVISSSAGAGKTTTACNIGLLMARSGSRVLVIDADLRKPKLTQALMPDASQGLLEVLFGKARMEDVLWREASTGCYFLPSVLTLRLSNTSDLLSSPAMEALIRQAGDAFDYVMVDCAPVRPVADVRSFSHMTDSFLLVAAWGETRREEIAAVAHAEFLSNKLLGTVMSKVDTGSLKFFEKYDDAYYSKEYA